MSTESQNFEHLEPIPVKYGYSLMLFAVFFFHIIHRIVGAIGPPKSVQTNPWKWKNLLISWVHAIIVGIWNLMWYVL